ncbi:hypothetical protein GCK72_025829 [Caenorhabditis remanei]|uniref:Uncharacterized protein n=1 Tax=Caenorhabditis remanei TaxID=31234 RepID=A0A6A5G3T9_CAERE|nr:hypothetical protein GCK72_025829 [Caenorhabditis remanei]KAF1749362.1 hypothetical protein GCK72_025829 [Caenorhabditis remanei]
MTTLDYISKSPSPNENLIPYTKKSLKRKLKSASRKPKTEIKVEQPPAELWPSGYKPENLAVLPNFIGEKDSEDRDVEEEPLFNKVLTVWSMQGFKNMNGTAETCEDLVYPECVPHNVKDFMIANMQFERYYEYQRAKLERKGWLAVMSRMMKGVVESKDMIEDFYGDKQKIGSNWKFEQQREKWSDLEDLEDLELQLKMRKAEITFKIIIWNRFQQQFYKQWQNIKISQCGIITNPEFMS